MEFHLSQPSLPQALEEMPLEKWGAAILLGKIWEKKFPLQAATGNPQPLLTEREKKST